MIMQSQDSTDSFLRNPARLNELAQTVYVAMVADPTASVADLADRVGHTEIEVREALNRLLDLSLVRPSREDADRLFPVDPVIGMRALLERQEAELEARRREIGANYAAVAKLLTESSNRTSWSRQEDTGIVSGLDRIQAKLEELAAGAQQEVMSVVPGREVPAASLDAARPGDLDLLRRNISVRVVYQEAARTSPGTVAFGLWMSQLGAQVRTAPVLPNRLFIVDHRAAVVPSATDSQHDAVYTTNPGLVHHLVALFERIWTDATPLDRVLEIDGSTGLTKLERELLALLAEGATDDAAAKRLGLSARTIRRIMAGLMDRLGAASRFEAGLRAKERGWL
jgi:DNA-binding CsgD family transcriptional regulator/sugar-specific transcriptional regulator TrmB